jgi:aryl-phospho-beta-D-glucosidase BglC (GH1 family)
MIDRRAFLGSSAAAAVVAGLDGRPVFGSDSNTPAPRQILQVRGLEIVEGNKPVRLRGVNLGGWMLIEDYMIGLPWTEWKIREQFRSVLGDQAYSAFFNAYMDSYIAEADIAFIAKSGFNFVRLPFNYRHFESDFAPGQWLEDGFWRLDYAVNLCRKHGLWVLFDLHAAPGAQARDQNAGSAFGEVYFWNYKQFIDRATALWKELARRYRGNAAVAGYNLLCEPVTNNVTLLNDFYLQTIRAIREVDQDHMIALDPNLWARDIASLHDQLFEDPQVIPLLHHYYTESAAFERLTSYPGKANGVVCDRAALEATLTGKFDDKRIHRPVIATEFGVERNTEQAFPVQLAITQDLVSIFEEKGWGWAIWCYKDLHSRGFVTPRTDTPWPRFLNSQPIAGLFKSYRELERPFVESVDKLLEGTDVDEDAREQWAREVSRDFDVPALDFVLRRLAGCSPSELAAMARSFAFESCEIHQDQLDALTPFLTIRIASS